MNIEKNSNEVADVGSWFNFEVDVIEYLRKYNAWRRGSDEYPQPDPKELGEKIDFACDELERLRKKLINPVKKPRYDDVYNAGIKMLNNGLGDG